MKSQEKSGEVSTDTSHKHERQHRTWSHVVEDPQVRCSCSQSGSYRASEEISKTGHLRACPFSSDIQGIKKFELYRVAEDDRKNEHDERVQASSLPPPTLSHKHRRCRTFFGSTSRVFDRLCAEQTAGALERAVCTIVCSSNERRQGCAGLRPC